MANPAISVIMTTYNQGRFIKEAIKSVLFQTYQDFELLIIDDGSTDGTKGIVEEFPSERIRYIYKEHSGISEARNSGIKEARGEYIIWVDSDDILLPEALGLQIREFEGDNSIDVVYGDSIVIDQEGRERYRISYKDYSSDRSILISELLFHNVLPHGSVMIKRECYNNVGGYDPLFEGSEDYEFWTRAAGRLKFRHIPEFLYRRRQMFDKGIDRVNKIGSCQRVELLRRMLKMYTLEELFPGIPWDKIERSIGESVAFYYIASIFLGRGGYQEAIDYFQRSIDLRPSLQAQQGLIQAYRDLGRLLADKGDYNNAVYYLNKAKEKIANIFKV